MQAQHKERKEFSWSTRTADTAVKSPAPGLLQPSWSNQDSRIVWGKMRDIPGVRTWRILRDYAFLLTSLPLGLAALMFMVIGGTLGASLSILLIGIPILIWTVGLTLRLASHERTRLKMLLDVDLGEPRYPSSNGENAFLHLLAIIRSPQVRRDLAYMLLLFPIGILELAVALLPVEFVVAPLLHLAFGSIIPGDVLGMDIGSRSEALLFLGLGGLLLLPVLMLVSAIASFHSEFAKKVLNRTPMA